MYAKWKQNRCQNEAGWVAKSFKIYQKSAKLRSNIYEHRSMKPSWGDFGRILCYLGCKLEVLGLSGRQDGGFRLHLGSQNGGPNPSKLLPRAIQKVIIFMIDLKIDFWRDLVPTWLYLNTQNLPKMRSSWLPNRSKLEC